MWDNGFVKSGMVLDIGARQMALNFMIHCGGEHLSREELNALPTPPPLGPKHVQVPYGEFVDLIEDSFRDVGLAFGETAFATNREHGQFFGMAEVKGLTMKQNKWATVAGFRGAWDQSLKRSLVIGDHVFVCDNLSISGEIEVGRKQTTNIMRDLPYLIHDAVAQIKGRHEAQEIRYDRYERAQLKDHQVNHAIIQMLRQGIINTQRVEKVVNEYYEPTHEEHLNENGERTIWTLHNAATESLKGVGLATLPRRTIQLQGLLDKATDYALAA